MEKVWQIANLYVATLRAIYLLEQHCHWTVKGAEFFSNHKLFERIYEGTQKDADLAAETMVGCFGCEAIDYNTQCDLIHKIMNKYADLQEKPIEQALALEKDFLALSEKVAKALEAANEMNLGIDDLLTGISNHRQEAVYLLGQVLKEAHQLTSETHKTASK